MVKGFGKRRGSYANQRNANSVFVAVLRKYRARVVLFPLSRRSVRSVYAPRHIIFVCGNPFILGWWLIVTSCPFCEGTDIRKKPDTIYRDSEIKGMREACANPDCNYTQFIADNSAKTEGKQ